MIIRNAKNKVKRILRKVELLKKNDACKKACQKHEADWKPLSKEEINAGFAKDKYVYTFYKNFGAGEEVDLSKYVTAKQYKSEILTRTNKLDHTITGAGFLSLFVEKNYFPMLFPEFVHPRIFVRKLQGVFYDADFNIIDEETAYKICSEQSNLVFKLSRDSKHGKGVRLVEKADYIRTFSEYGDNFIVQDVIKQHESLAYFNESSVNPIRIISLCWRGAVYILCAKLKVGAPGSFVDLGVTDKYPVAIGINDDGTFDKRAFEPEYDYKIYDNVFGKEIKGCVPNYDKMKEAVCKAHLRYPDYGILGWDLSVDCEGKIVFIEVNSRAPAIVDSQCICGPFFSKLSKDGRPLKDEILSTPLDLSSLKAF